MLLLEKIIRRCKPGHRIASARYAALAMGPAFNVRRIVQVWGETNSIWSCSIQCRSLCPTYRRQRCRHP
jgi:hypothetical protein